MALEHRVDPNRYDRILNDNLRYERAVDPTVHGGWRWIWVWPLIAALFLWWAGWGWGGSGGWWFAHLHSENHVADSGGSRAPLQQADTARDILASRDKVMFIGQRFEANNIPVQKRVNSRVIWIGADNPMLAIMPGTPSDVVKNAAAGKEIDVAGVIKQAPAPDQAKQQWALNDQDMLQLERQGAYIELSQMTTPETGTDH